MKTAPRTAFLAAALMLLTSDEAKAQFKMSAERVYPGSALFACSPPADHHRIFVVSQNGQIFIVKDGVILTTPFLNIQGTVASGGEAGLLGLAFHPQYNSNGRLYVYYTTTSGVTVASYAIDANNPDRADPASAVTILKITRPLGNHFGGWMAYGPDGYLYIASGNAGGPGNSQPTSTLLGKLLRIDVDHDDFPADPNRNYAIPLTNPFFGSATSLPEIWALGLRNPWRCSFDRFTGDLWIGDVGDTREEIDFQPAALVPPFSARNYGYPCMDGSACASPIGCTCGQPGLSLPVIEYQTHTLGIAVMGGYVYRGSRTPELQGWYLFGDYQSGARWRFRFTASGFEGPEPVQITGLPSSLQSFGEDASGELYACGNQGVYRLIPFCSANCDNSVTTPLLTVNDFQCFLNKFAAGDSYADCDGSTLPPILTANDFTCFLDRYAEGCP